MLDLVLDKFLNEKRRNLPYRIYLSAVAKYFIPEAKKWANS
jgi:hypothetical protein